MNLAEVIWQIQMIYALPDTDEPITIVQLGDANCIPLPISVNAVLDEIAGYFYTTRINAVRNTKTCIGIHREMPIAPDPDYVL